MTTVPQQPAPGQGPLGNLDNPDQRIVRVAVIGYGYWGPNLVRNYFEAQGSTVAAIVDLNPERLANASRRYPSIRTTSDVAAVLQDPEVDAVVIATPVRTHYQLALEAIRNGKHVLVEKPIAESSDQARALIRAAQEHCVVLMVDHTFVYTGAIQRIRELIKSDRIGQVRYYDSVRVNLGLFQQDVSVLWDLAVHDLAIMDYVLDSRPHAVSAVGVAHVPGQPVNTAYLTCFFESNLLAHFHVNWLAPLKIRRTLIGGDRQMIVYDDIEPSEKVKVYDTGVHFNDPTSDEKRQEAMVSYRTGDVWIPQLPATEGLHTEALHFLECIRTGQRPITDGQAGLRVVRILEAATQSIGQSGRPVGLTWTD